MEKLKAKLLTYELPLHIYLKYDCQNGMFIIGLFPVGDFIKMCRSYFFSVYFISCWKDWTVSQFLEIELQAAKNNLPLWNNLQQQAFPVQIRVQIRW